MEVPKDLKDLTEKVAQEKPTNVDEALKITKEFAHQINSLEDKMKKIQAARGAVLESSTHIEKVFDELIARSDKPEMVSSRFRTKAKFLRKLMEIFDPEKKTLDEEFLIDLENVVILRNIFAHVPVDYFPADLEFDSSEIYIHYFNGDLKLKNVKFSTNLFMESAKNILAKVPEFIKIVIDIAEKQRKFMDDINQLLKEISEEEKKDNCSGIDPTKIPR
jgi:hypothetical protein